MESTPNHDYLHYKRAILFMKTFKHYINILYNKFIESSKEIQHNNITQLLKSNINISFKHISINTIENFKSFVYNCKINGLYLLNIINDEIRNIRKKKLVFNFRLFYDEFKRKIATSKLVPYQLPTYDEFYQLIFNYTYFNNQTFEQWAKSIFEDYDIPQINILHENNAINTEQLIQNYHLNITLDPHEQTYETNLDYLQIYRNETKPFFIANFGITQYTKYQFIDNCTNLWGDETHKHQTYHRLVNSNINLQPVLEQLAAFNEIIHGNNEEEENEEDEYFFNDGSLSSITDAIEQNIQNQENEDEPISLDEDDLQIINNL
jgi:hypothetical protein